MRVYRHEPIAQQVKNILVIHTQTHKHSNDLCPLHNRNFQNCIVRPFNFFLYSTWVRLYAVCGCVLSYSFDFSLLLLCVIFYSIKFEKSIVRMSTVQKKKKNLAIPSK